MPVAKDLTMLAPNPRKFLIALGESELEPKELAEKAGIPVNIVYSMRKGCYTKPRYIGAVSRVLGVKIADLLG